VAFGGFLGCKGSLSIGGRWPTGEGMAAWALVILDGVTSACWVAAIALPFSSFVEGEFLEPCFLPPKR